MKELTDGGYYTCHSKFDTTGEHDIHFSVHVNCELKKCHGNASNVNDLFATTAGAPNYLNEITAISTPHLTPTSSNSSVKSIRTGDGRPSLVKRDISSNPSPMPSKPSVLKPNQHSKLYDVEITTATVRSNSDATNEKYNNSRQMPTPTHQQSKRRG